LLLFCNPRIALHQDLHSFPTRRSSDLLESEKREGENVYVPAWKQAKDTIVSLNIYNRTLNKLENVNLDNLTAKDRKENVMNQRRSEEHTSELQSRFDLVCRLLLEKKNN